MLNAIYLRLRALGNSSQNSMVLHSEGQVKLHHLLFEKFNRNRVALSERVVDILKRIVEGNLTLEENANNFLNQHAFSLMLLSRLELISLSSH